MNCTRTALALALSLCWAQQGVGQSVYRCEKDGQTVFSQQPCDEATTEAAVSEKRRQAEIEAEAERLLSGARERAREGRADEPVRITRQTCRVRDTGTTEAIVEVASDLPRPVRARVTIRFTRDGEIIGVDKPAFTIPANGSETISRLGPLGVTADRCEYSLDAKL